MLVTRVILVILDGWGWSPIPHGNLLAQTPTPALETLLGLADWTMLKTASLEIGRPWGSIGDSELGHYNLGTGRVVVRQGQGDEDLVEVRERATALAGEPPALAEPAAAVRMTDSPVISLGTILAGAGWRQLKLATKTKLPLLTRALNGYPRLNLPGEDTLALAEETELAATLEQALAEEETVLTVINLAGADQAAHQGELAAVARAIAAIDRQLEELAELAIAQGAILYLAADHGGIEQMLSEHDQILPDHSTAPVVLVRFDGRLRRGKPIYWAAHPKRKEQVSLSTPSGLLADIAPTILEEFGLPRPATMVGISLLRTLTGQGVVR